MWTEHELAYNPDILHNFNRQKQKLLSFHFLHIIKTYGMEWNVELQMMQKKKESLTLKV